MSPTPRSIDEIGVPLIVLLAIFFAVLLTYIVLWACSKLPRHRDPIPARGIELVLVRTQTPNTDAAAPNREQRNSFENQDVSHRYSGATLRESENAGVIDGRRDTDARVPARPSRVYRRSREEGTDGTASVEGWEMV